MDTTSLAPQDMVRTPLTSRPLHNTHIPHTNLFARSRRRTGPHRASQHLHTSLHCVRYLSLLTETLTRCLRSCEPLLQPAEFKETERIVAEFASGLRPELQQQLERRARECAAADTHWLSAWWEHFAYLANRSPLLCKWNVFGTLLHASPHPSRHLRAARVLHAFAEFYLHLIYKRLAPDVLDTRGTIPLCMRQYDRLFASSRVPGEGLDSLVTLPTGAEHTAHASIFCDGYAYTLRLLSAPVLEGSAEPTPVPIAALTEALAAIDAHAASRGPNPSPLAMLTAIDRDGWAKHRQATCEASAVNDWSIERIEGSLVSLSLERSSPSDVKALCRASHEGADAHNVWFDKPVSLLMFANGRLGINCEHAHFDAPIPARVFAYVGRSVLKAEAEDGKTKPVIATAAKAAPAEWKPLEIRPPATVAKAIADAPSTCLNDLRHNNRLVPIRFEGGGRKEALLLRPLSADSIVQMALQLAQRRDMGSLVSTYEAATTRRFNNGRTETIRSCSPSAERFTSLMLREETSASEKYAALGAALTEHGEWLVACSSGRGVDRHLMGLRIIAAMSGMDSPAIFEDLGYTRSTDFQLSTSNTSNPGIGPAYYDFGGFGAPLIECYGAAYQIQEHAIQLTISSDARCKARDADRFAKAVLQALTDVYKLIEEGAPEIGASAMRARSRL